jgi:hypothetical protein
MGTEVDVTNKKPSGIWHQRMRRLHAIKLGATDTQLNRIGASIASVEQRSRQSKGYSVG